MTIRIQRYEVSNALGSRLEKPYLLRTGDYVTVCWKLIGSVSSEGKRLYKLDLRSIPKKHRPNFQIAY